MEIPKYVRLSEVCQRLSTAVANEFKEAVWIKAEIAKLNFYPRSGHCYPELVEKENNEIVAEIRATIWAGNFAVISSKFQQETKENLREGMTVLVLGKPGYSPKYGLAVNIIDILPSFTLGAMALEKQKCIERLKKEGIFDQNLNLPLPLLPKRLAIISVETSKGFNDFKEIIHSNNKGYVVEYTLFSAILQGERAVETISEQLERIKKIKERFDAVLIIRGGGGDTGLSCYDSYTLASKVATFPLPVLSGIGHSTNQTVVEMVCRLNKITPTDLAYFILSCYDEVNAATENAYDRIIQLSLSFTDTQNTLLKNYTERFARNALKPIQLNKNKILSFSYTIRNSGKLRFSHSRNLLEKYQLTISHSLKNILLSQNRYLTQCQTSLKNNSYKLFENNSKLLTHAEQKVNILDPVNTLKRGYSLTFHKGKLVKEAKNLKAGDELLTQFADGTVKSKIE